MLAEVAATMMDELKLRLRARAVVRHERELREQAERLVHELQASVLPSALRAIDGAATAALYVPADAAGVGGDFYDLFTIDDWNVLAVGDVCGKGPGAALMTSLARHTMRSAALWAHRPPEILTHLNQVMTRHHGGAQIEHYLTAQLAWLRRRPTGFALTLASAGHPPALIAKPDGHCLELGGPATPVGCFPDATFNIVTAELERGDRLLMFTDGLTEARTRKGFLGIDAVKNCLATTEPSAQGTIDGLRQLLTSGDITVTDDLTAVVLLAGGPDGSAPPARAPRRQVARTRNADCSQPERNGYEPARG
jgi:sigma-B regulation protein RsbU (phosphoserine phosphatase)